ncbi:12074_t:CDS:2 [Entrophospora sp. SA101]|nr:1790_t:CDS:2 [Entrophospora sp. SA101]CAJ0759499.1 16771_t:CDS:2 [Entrophospora sp. SA101]CAJ0763047.1 12074_t:CDS:2 [Entrophospora sp. SA101]CAJ0926395.1 5598_t:CDS:2 [Entrophospora sp. SA101]
MPSLGLETLRFQPSYFQVGDIYSLGIILWELSFDITDGTNYENLQNKMDRGYDS